MSESFFTLPADQQIRRLHAAAESLLPAYHLAGATLDLITYQSHAVFRVVMNQQPVAVLRVYRPNHKPLEQLISEQLLLQVIGKRSVLRIPQPTATQTGQPLAFAEITGLPDPLPVAVFTWCPGIQFTPDTLPLEGASAAGKLLGSLHHVLDEFTLPDTFSRPTLDAEGLFGRRSPYYSPHAVTFFTEEQQAIFSAVETQTGAAMHALRDQPQAFGLIHGDFIPQNILFPTGSLDEQPEYLPTLLDFEDSGFGFRLYDLAPALWQFKSTDRYPALRSAFLNGYTAAQSLTEPDLAHLETFIAARQVASCRWLAANQHNPAIRDKAPMLVASRALELEHFLKSGRFGD